MPTLKRPWWRNIYLEFYLYLPLLTIQTRLLRDSLHRTTYDICRVKAELWKWSWEFDLYRRER